MTDAYLLAALRDQWRTRPTGGTQRERQSWANGFAEALETIGGSGLVIQVTGDTMPVLVP